MCAACIQARSFTGNEPFRETMPGRGTPFYVGRSYSDEKIARFFTKNIPEMRANFERTEISLD